MSSFLQQRKDARLQKRRDAKILGFDRWMRFRDPERMARALADASKQINKKRHVSLVESNGKYGNVRALAVALKDHLEPNEFTFIAHNKAGVEWGQSQGINSAKFSLKPEPANIAIWEKLLTSSVSVHESHDFWRTREGMFKRALLSGSKKIQLWHGSAGPIGKEIALGRLTAQPAMWHFTAIATTSVGWHSLVCEPNFDEARRLDRVQAENVIHDIEFRMVPVLKAGTWVKPEKPVVVVAPTFPESVEGESVLAGWIEKLSNWALESKVEVRVHLHPSSKMSLKEKVDKMRGVTRIPGGVPSMQLREVSLIITDFSSIAHDALLVGTPVMMVVGDIETYKQDREIFIDQEQWDCVYVTSDFEMISQQIESALTEDSLQTQRMEFAKHAQLALRQLPGTNTIAAIKSLM
jgi:hypothetical protein